SCTRSLRRPSRGQYAFGSHNDFSPSNNYDQYRSFLQHASPQLARLVRHALNRGNVLEGPLRDRTADGGNPACQGQVSTQVSRSKPSARRSEMGQEEPVPARRLSGREGSTAAVRGSPGERQPMAYPRTSAHPL